MSTLTSIHHTRSPSQGNRQNKQTPYRLGKKERKLSLFTDDMSIYVENSKELKKKKILQLTNELSKDAQ